MTQETINNGESGAVVRGKLNNNFTELYTEVAGKQPAGSYEAAGTSAADMAAHVADVDPHPQYLTPAEGAAAYAPLASTTYARGVHVTQPFITAGAFVTPQVTALALGTIAAAANRLDYLPFIPVRDITVDRLDVEVSTLIAAALGRLAIYADNNGVPGALLRDGATTIDCSTTGLKSATITSLIMTAGTVYWLAILSSSTQTYRGIAVGGLMPMLVNATLNTTYVHKRQTQTFASGMPATASGLSDISGTFPLIKLRLA